MNTSIKEVAKLAGVSVATVSHVLNKTKNVRPETSQRVTDAVEKLNYRINPLARNFRKGESKIIGFVVSNLSNYFFQDIAHGMEARLKQAGYRLVLIDSEEDKNAEIENVKNLLATSVDGLIIAPTTEDCSYLNFLVDTQRLPIVFVDRKPIGFESDLVMSTNEQGVYEAIRYLIGKGHRDIGFVASRYDTTMKERLDGYRRALEEAGIPFNANYVKMGDKLSASPRELRHGISYTQTRDLLSNYNVSAIFSGNNLASVGVFSCFRETNIKVPDDIAFLTFDDSFWLTMTSPSISAVAQNHEEIGRVAGEIICDRLTNPASADKPPHLVRIPTQMVLRGSC